MSLHRHSLGSALPLTTWTSVSAPKRSPHPQLSSPPNPVSCSCQKFCTKTWLRLCQIPRRLMAPPLPLCPPPLSLPLCPVPQLVPTAVTLLHPFSFSRLFPRLYPHSTWTAQHWAPPFTAGHGRATYTGTLSSCVAMMSGLVGVNGPSSA